MNRAQVKAQLAHMRAKFEADLTTSLTRLVPGDDDYNLTVLANVQYNADYLAKLALADQYADKVPDVDSAAPAPTPPPPAPVVGGKAGWPLEQVAKIVKKVTVR
jgi:hypothetical protein